MAESSEVLDFLRVRFARTDEKLDRVSNDMLEVKQRITALEIQVGTLVATEQTHYGTIMQRFDRLETRIDRIERRLDLTDAPA
jgi:phage shock protein A